MDLESVYYVGQTIAVVAILCSLVFVGFQVRQSNKDARSQSRQGLIDTFAGLNWELSQHPDLLRILATGVKDWSRLSNMEKTQFETMMGQYLQNLQKGILQFEDGILDAHTLDNIANFMLMTVLMPGGKAWYEQSVWPSPEVRNYIANRLRQPETLPAPMNEATPHWAALADETIAEA
jgi:hypothetical protein